MIVKGIHYLEEFDYKYDPSFVMACLRHGNYNIYEIVDERLSLIRTFQDPTFAISWLPVLENIISKLNFYIWWRSSSYAKAKTWWFWS